MDGGNGKGRGGLDTEGEEEEDDGVRGEGQVVMNALLFTAGRLQYEGVSGSWDSTSFARKTDRMASVSSHEERGEGMHIPAHNIQHVTSAGRKPRKRLSARNDIALRILSQSCPGALDNP